MAECTVCGRNIGGVIEEMEKKDAKKAETAFELMDWMMKGGVMQREDRWCPECCIEVYRAMRVEAAARIKSLRREE